MCILRVDGRASEVIAPGDQMEICEDTHEFSPDRIVVLFKIFQNDATGFSVPSL